MLRELGPERFRRVERHLDAYAVIAADDAVVTGMWLNGSICTRRPLTRSLRHIVVETGRTIGYVPGNHVDADKYKVESSVWLLVEDPGRWTKHVNDQSIVVGWAGYDERTCFLPPEHFLAHEFRDAIVQSCRNGALAGHGPDGKLLVRLRGQTHVPHRPDRVLCGADAAVRAVQSGAKECLVRLCYAPNVPAPLDINVEMVGRGERQPESFFDHGSMVERYSPECIAAEVGTGTHFFDAGLPWDESATGRPELGV